MIRAVLPPVLVLALLTSVVVYFHEPAGDAALRDDDLCPVDTNAIAGNAAYLVDLQKPLDAEQASLPGELLREITLDLNANTELRVFLLVGSESAPRALLHRVCKPYDNDDLLVETAKDQHRSAGDCESLPAQMPDELRQSAKQFCARRDALGRRLDALAAAPRSDEGLLTNAYLLEAFEDFKLEFLERSVPQALYVFSDMMQHAHWYSHLDLEWTAWRSSEFDDLLKAQNWIFDQSEFGRDLRVEAFYVPLAGSTDQSRVKKVHQQFWRDYFGPAQIAYHDQPAMPSYRAQPRMNVPTEAEIAARERLANEQLLARIQREQAALEREQRALEAERQRQEERAQQEQEEERLRQEEERRRQEEENRQRAALAGRSEEVERPQQIPEAAPQPQTVTATPDPSLRLEDPPEEAPAALPEPEPPESEPQPDEYGDEALHAAVAGDVPFCELEFAAGQEATSPIYPRHGEMDLGDAVITVRYVVNEQGETVDDETTVVREQSSADRLRYFNLFMKEALRAVRNLSFRFVEPDDGSCIRYQTRTTSFRFFYE